MLKTVNMNGNIFQIYFTHKNFYQGTSNFVQHVFEKKKTFHNDISPHFKFLFSNESLDFCDLKKIKDQKD